MTITNQNDDAYANAAFINNSEEIVAGWEKKANHFRLKKLKSENKLFIKKGIHGSYSIVHLNEYYLKNLKYLPRVLK